MKRMKVLSVLSIVVMLCLSVLPVTAQGPDPGKGNTDIYAMNMDGSATAGGSVQYINPAGGVDATKPLSIAPLGSQEFTAASSGVGDGWLGSAVVWADKEVAANVNAVWTDGYSKKDGITAGAYTGYSAGSDTMYLPFVVFNPNIQFTRFSVQNTATDTASITMTYLNRDGVQDFQFTDSIPAQAQKTYDMSTTGAKIPTWTSSSYYNSNGNWTGAVVVTANKPIVAVASNHWREWAVIYNGSGSGSTKTFVPSVERRYVVQGGIQKWRGFSVIAIQNLSSATTASVTLHYINAFTGLEDLTIGPETINPQAAKGFNTKSGGDVDKTLYNVLGDAWVGSVIIDSTVDVAVIAYSIRPTSKMAGSTLGVTSAVAGTKTFLPMAYQKKSGSTWVRWSLLRIQNPGTTTASDVDIYFKNRDGTTAASLLNQTIAGEKSMNWNTKNHEAQIPLGGNWEGGVYIEADQPLVAVMETLDGVYWMSAYNGVSK